MATPPWLHGEIGRQEVEDLLRADDGTWPTAMWAVRQRPGQPGEYVLALNFKGKATHHLIQRDAQNRYVINGKSYGDHTDLQSLIETLKDPAVKGWPVPLTFPVFRPELQVGPGDIGARVFVDGYCEGTLRFFGPHDSKPGLRAGVQLEKPVGLNNGTVGGHVYFSCAPNHGALVAPSKVWKLSADAIPAPAPEPSRVTEIPMPIAREAVFWDDEWFFEEMNNTQAANLVQAHEAGTQDGAFLIRRRGADYPNDYCLTVTFKGKPTHHLITSSPNGTLMVNNKNVDGATTVADVVTLLQNKQPWWPVPLKCVVRQTTEEKQQIKAQAEAQRRKAEEEIEQKRVELKRIQDQAAELERQRKVKEEKLRQEAANHERRNEEERQRAQLAVDIDLSAMEAFIDEEDGGIMGFGGLDNEDSNCEQLPPQEAPADNLKALPQKTRPVGGIRVLPDREPSPLLQQQQADDNAEEEQDQPKGEEAQDDEEQQKYTEEQEEQEPEKSPEPEPISEPVSQSMSLEQRASLFGGVKQTTSTSSAPIFKRRISSEPEPKAAVTVPRPVSDRKVSPGHSSNGERDAYEVAKERRKELESKQARERDTLLKERVTREKQFKAKQLARREREQREQQADFDRLEHEEVAEKRRLAQVQSARTDHGLTPVQRTLAKERWTFEDRESEAKIIQKRSAIERKWLTRADERQKLELEELQAFEQQEAQRRAQEDGHEKGGKPSGMLFEKLNKFEQHSSA